MTKKKPAKPIVIGNLAKLGFSRYHVTRNGKVFNVVTGRQLRSYVNKRGYTLYVLMTDDHKVARMWCHRLVALTYIPNPDNLPQVDHLDANPRNNTVENLEWVTNRENQLRAIRNNPNRRLACTETQVEEICQSLERGETAASISRRMCLPYTAVAAIKKRRIWTHISDKYPDF